MHTYIFSNAIFINLYKTKPPINIQYNFHFQYIFFSKNICNSSISVHIYIYNNYGITIIPNQLTMSENTWQLILTKSLDFKAYKTQDQRIIIQRFPNECQICKHVCTYHTIDSPFPKISDGSTYPITQNWIQHTYTY